MSMDMQHSWTGPLELEGYIYRKRIHIHDRSVREIKVGGGRKLITLEWRGRFAMHEWKLY